MSTIAEDYTRSPTYDSLVEMIKLYINRRDEATVDMIPFFINSAEKMILRRLRMPSMQTLVSVDVSEITDSFIELPYDYLEMKFVWTVGDKPGTLQRVTLDFLLRGSPTLTYNQYVLNGNGENLTGGNTNITTNETYFQADGDFNSGYYAINGNRMYLSNVATEGIMLNYFVDVPELRTETQTNVLLTLVPDAFLYLAVSEGWKFLMEAEKSQYWDLFGNNRLNAVQLQEDNAEFSGSPLVISPM